MYGTMFAIVFPSHSCVSKVFPTEKPMGSSRDILPRHTKSGKQPKVALGREWALATCIAKQPLKPYRRAIHYQQTPYKNDETHDRITVCRWETSVHSDRWQHPTA